MRIDEPETRQVAASMGADIPVRKRSWLRLCLALIVLLTIVGFVGWRVRGAHQETAAAALKTTDSANRPVPVLVAEVQQKKMPIYLTELGAITAYNTVAIKSRVDGQLVKVSFKEGQAVRRGALLLQIDPEPFAAALELAEGQYAKDQATASMGKAESSRYQALYSAGVVSHESQETQEALYGQAQGALKADLAAIHAAKVNLAYTRITSPIDGVVGLRQVDVGNIVHAADANGLLVVTQLQPISVIFTVPEDQLPLIRKRLRAKEPLKVEAYDRTMTTKLATGTLLTVDNEIDVSTGMDKLKAVFPNKDTALFPNQFVNIRLILEERPNVLVIPAAAMQVGNAGNFVYVVTADSTVEARPLTGATTQGAVMLVDSGLRPGERVVIDGQEKIHAGSKIVISKGPPAKGEGAVKGYAKAQADKSAGDGKTGKDATPGSPKAGSHGAKVKGSGKSAGTSSGANP